MGMADNNQTDDTHCQGKNEQENRLGLLDSGDDDGGAVGVGTFGRNGRSRSLDRFVVCCCCSE